MANFRSGAEQAEQAASHPSFNSIKYFSLNEGESAYVRLLSGHLEGEGYLTVDQHNASPTRPAPAGYQGKWPQIMSATCRNDQAFRGDPMHGDCFLCAEFARTGDKRAYKPSSRSWALAVVRKPMMENGRAVGFEDSMIEIERDGQKLMVPEIVILNFAWNNFWANLANTYVTHGTWNDRDLYIRRTGKELTTNYPVSEQEPVAWPSGRTRNIALAQHEANPEAFPDPGPVFDTRIIEHAGPYLFALGISPAEAESKYNNNPQLAIQAEVEKLVMDRVSDEYFDRFFDTRHPQPVHSSDGGSGGQQASSGSTPPPVAAPSTPQPDNDELAALAQRVQGVPGYGTPAPSGVAS